MFDEAVSPNGVLPEGGFSASSVSVYLALDTTLGTTRDVLRFSDGTICIY